MKEIFNILNALEIEDVDWLLMNGRERRIKSDTVLIEEGAHPGSIFIVLQGLLGVKNSAVSSTDRLALLGPGEVLGELSFLDKRPASASVIAVEGSMVLELSNEMLEPRLEEDPRFAVRFYRALALGNAIRLRNTVKKLGTELNEVDEVQQTERSSDWEILLEEIQGFKELLQRADKAIQQHEGRVPDDYKEKIFSGLLALANQLEQTLGVSSKLHVNEKEELGRKAKIELLPYLLLTELGERIYTKPRGYAGDFLTIHRIYENEPQGRGRIGPALDAAFQNLPMIHAIRERRSILKDSLNTAIHEKGKEGLEVTSLACGPADEIFQAYQALADPSLLKANLLNIDLQAVKFVEERIKANGLEAYCKSITSNLVYLALGRQDLNLPPQDLIYNAGLIEYFNDSFVVQLLDYIYQNLRDGGQVILGFFTPDKPQRALMDHVLDWELIYRKPKDLNALFRSSKFGKSCSKFEAVEGAYQFAFCEK